MVYDQSAGEELLDECSHSVSVAELSLDANSEGVGSDEPLVIEILPSPNDRLSF